MPNVSNKRRLPTISMAALLAATSMHLAPLVAVGLLMSSPAAAKDGNSQSGNSGGNSGSGGESNSGGGGRSGESGHSGDGRSGEDGGHGGDAGAAHDVRRAMSGFTVEVKTDGGDVEVIYPDGWKEGIHHGIFQLQDPAGRKVVERQATAEDLARLDDIAR